MKKIIKLNIIIVLILCFSFVTSCYTKKVNSFVVGAFVGEVGDIKYYFEVEEIEKEIFENEWPVNVVKDLSVKNKYYKVCFYWYDDNNFQSYSFEYLKDWTPKSKSVPLEYKDQNDNVIIPASVYGEHKYTIIYNKQYIDFKEVE